MLDRDLARTLDPRAAAPQRRLEIVKALATAGIPVGVNVAPIIPQLTDKDMESILEAAAAAGATHAGYMLLRLPREVAPLFRAWLDAHYPLRAAHVMSIVQDIRGGRDNDPRFGFADARPGSIRRAHQEALRTRLQAPGAQRQAQRSARHDAIPAAAQRGSARPVLTALAALHSQDST